MATSAVVEFLLKYSEAGGELPAKVARDLDRLATGGGKMRESFLGAAEGTGQLRRGLEILAERAVGVEGPIGRVSAGLLHLGAGSAITLAVVAGVGSIGFAIQKLTDPARAATEAMKKFTDGLSAGQTPLQRYQDLVAKTEQGLAQMTARANAAERILTGAGLGLPGNALINFFTGRARKAATAAEGAAQEAVYTSEVVSQEKYLANLRHEVELTGASVSLRAQMLAQWAGLDEGGQRDAVRLSLELHARQELLRVEQERAKLFEHERDLFRAERSEQAMQLSIGRIRLSQAAGIFQFGGGGGPLPDLPPGTIDLDTGQSPRETLRRIADSQSLNMPFENIGRADGGTGTGLDVQRLIAASFAAVGSARGGIGGALAGAGGIAAVIPGLQVPGAILGGLGGLVSLFSGGGAKVTISRLEQEALEQMRSVQQMPQNVSVNVVGSQNGRATKYALDRATGLDTSSRLPV